MNQFINTKKEMFLGDRYFKEHVMPEGYDYKEHKKELVPFFGTKGFQVSRMYREFFQKYSQIESEKYLSMDLYYFYVIPALNKYEFKDAWLDKNIYTELFPNALQPKTVVKNMNGHFYADGKEIKFTETVERIMSERDPLILKPTVRTCNGNGVRQIDSANKDEKSIGKLFIEYGRDFIVQVKAHQHEGLKSFNPSSLNTLRVFTYRNLEGKVVYLDHPHFRFGGKDAIMDNAASGGGFCPIEQDGTLRDKIYRFKHHEVGSLSKDKNIKHFIIPSYQKAKQFVVKLHERLPYFDFVGWDISINEEGEPFLVEYNLVPSCEGPQFYSPLFGDYLEEVIYRAGQVSKEEVHFVKSTFGKGASEFFLDIR